MNDSDLFPPLPTDTERDDYISDCNRMADAAYRIGFRLARMDARQGILQDAPAMPDTFPEAPLQAAGFKSLREWEDTHGYLDMGDIRDNYLSGYWAGHSDAH
jgi:hypothetical protein